MHKSGSLQVSVRLTPTEGQLPGACAVPANNSWHAPLPESYNLPCSPLHTEIKTIPGSASVRTTAELLLLAGKLPFRV